MGRTIGIDLGTTYSAVAVIGESGHPEILTNAEGENTTPSVVLFSANGDEDEPIVGTAAKHMAVTSPDDVVQFVKRHMGDPYWSFDSPTEHTYKAEEISAIILRRLKQDAEFVLGESVTDAVITVPAYFDDARRTATKQAATIAGLNVLRVLNEPTAAALSYGMENDDDGIILVYDLGGGTFDVTALRLQGGQFEVLATDGNRNLGGFDFDNALMNLIADNITTQGGENILMDTTAVADLREKAEAAKRALSSVPATSVFLSFRGNQYRVRVTREQFERATENLLSETRDTVMDVMDDAGLDWDQVDHLLLVGGSTRMPMVRDMMMKLSGKRPEVSVNPDEAVALGAAVQGEVENRGTGLPTVGGGKPIQIQDVTSQALGYAALNPDTDIMENCVMIPRNSKLPAVGEGIFCTVCDDQTELRVRVLQGDNPNIDLAVEIGETILQIPPYPQGAPIRVTFRYDIDQMVQVEVFDLTANALLGQFEIDRSANMNEAEVQAAAERMASLHVE